MQSRTKLWRHWKYRFLSGINSNSNWGGGGGLWQGGLLFNSGTRGGLCDFKNRKSEKKLMKMNPKRTADDTIPKAKLIISL